jgi:23S rRNA pseudouridine2605 synthase
MSARSPRNRKPVHKAPRTAASREENGGAAGDRLQKVLAAAGLGSRRQCEELISNGRVEVDRKTVTELGTKVDANRQEIRVDGVAISHPRRVYYAVNKPAGVISTNRDPARRPRVIDLIPTAEQERLFPVGRLDLNSEGLILVTNDGELANRLTHPRYGAKKTYRVLVAGIPERETLEKLQRGVHLAEGIARVASIEVKKQLKQSTLLEIVLQEGHNREIRRILASFGHKVLRLLRIAVGPIRLGKLPPGGYRRLSHDEIDTLRRETRAAGQDQA